MTAEPTPPAPLPEGKGEGTQTSATSEGAQEATPAVTPSLQGGDRGGSLRRKLALLLAFALVAASVWYFAIRTPEPTNDLGRFQGEWQLAVPAVDRDNKPAARARPVTIRVEGDRWVYIADGKERRSALTLRPDADPKEIDLTLLGPDDKPTAFVLRGIYTIDRDRAKVATAPASEPRPANPEEAGTVWLLDRVK